MLGKPSRNGNSLAFCQGDGGVNPPPNPLVVSGSFPGKTISVKLSQHRNIIVFEGEKEKNVIIDD